MSASEIVSSPLKENIASLIQSAGFTSSFQLEPLEGGANNQSFAVLLNDKKLFLKHYFQHGDDKRNRLEAEYSFLQYAWSYGIKECPKPLADNNTTHLGLYEYIEGRPANENDIHKDNLNQFISFFHRLNEFRGTGLAKTLNNGSETCFSIQDHISLVEHRIQNLNQIKSQSPLYSEAKYFISEKVVPIWEDIKKSTPSETQDLGWESRCLSPSDFGFHNVIVKKDGKLTFIDFEYAGWDDPSRTVCDFFCQPKLPVPLSEWNRLQKEFLSVFPESNLLIDRSNALLPVYRIKWICIQLNEFLPTGHQRRHFSRLTESLETRQTRQLKNAQLSLDQLKNLS